MIKGVLLKGYGGFYYVYAEDRVWECSLRGRFRIKDQEFIPGDQVVILPEGEDKATIEAVEPRRNSLSRPAIANVDQAILVFALTSPKPDRNLLDRLLIQVTEAEIEPIIVFTKLDKIEEDALSNDTEVPSISDVYRNIGYTVFEVSNKTGQGVEEFGSRLSKKISVLAGPSGVGKSSLFNALSPGKNLKIGDISVKSKRGRHTTRHVELMVCAGGLVADTPGFSALAMPVMKRADLSDFFLEFASRRGQCRFSSCLHDKEPNCAIKAALEKGEISPSRYEHYLIFLQEVMEAERKY
ncbi:ribosome small subunit-dependent GTPase A [Desulfosporosinus sp. BICA1-9]|uniref:ribosome small subunit-dependent GTPase A n=1 Tax=Desulfosporosinus sp. BICA1-9 TaxID=1531958 RepID=UPI00054B94BA|nr:ribosome small subunit-dependent GTPase A [Desulfosporosinus sp. BICA1-9]KJS48694.1 MAG: GTPase RsgA [Peptococcaceae bacterium BRH_c23]KJS90484.1 MAG: GTPase RsgA [Desulfosporosinus sp. BICA1-9]HBW38432.1 ribosome small subunit-dependent GTPase A [Desulfosporosinus sp.]